jgi:putative GTP pyrophosphokinase
MTRLLENYRRRHDTVLKPVATAVEGHLREIFGNVPRIDRVTARAKSIERFMAKADTKVRGRKKYSEPLQQIQDEMGARIVTFYWSDVDRVGQLVLKYSRPIELKDMVPDSQWKFGYFGRHYILFLPADVVDRSMDRALVPQVFELQIKTLFQHAWSEANHDLGYKPGSKPLNSDEERRLAFTSAQAWGADRVFDELLPNVRNFSTGRLRLGLNRRHRCDECGIVC